MRQSAVEHALGLFRRYDITLEGLAALDVGGTREVWLELSRFVTPKPGALLAQKALRRIGLAAVSPPRPAVIVTGNPLLERIPQLQFLDYGFNEAALGTNADIKGDFLDPACVSCLNGKYDLALSFDTLEHVNDPFTFCRHLVEVTRPGGHIYLATVFAWEYHPSPRDYFRFSPDGLLACFAGTDAAVIECDWHVPEVSVFAFLQRNR